MASGTRRRIYCTSKKTFIFQQFMDKNIETNSQTRIQLSLAALMFFSPLVQNVIKKENMELNEDDKTFIKGYIRF